MPNLFKLPRIQANTAIVNNVGKALIYFTRFWDEFATAIENQINSIIDVQATLISQQAQITANVQAIQDALEAVGIVTQQAQSAAAAANEAQTTADAAGGGTAVSGSATNPAVDITGTSWIPGPVVSLTGVVAGNLTITGSGPQQDDDVALSVEDRIFFDFRIVEVVATVDTVLFTGFFRAQRYGTTTTISNNSAGDVAAFSSARASTGAVDYRIDVRGPGTADLTSLSLYIYARRS